MNTKLNESTAEAVPLFADVLDAANRLKGIVHRTPIVTCRAIDRQGSSQVRRKFFFKAEHLQKVGAFKFRDAMNAVSLLSDRALESGVVTHSSGNHAQALALAAKIRGISAHIVMPSNSNPIKRNAVKEYGGNVIDCQPTLTSREETALSIQQETGATMIHPFNHPHIIAGQGTAAIELINQVPDLDLIIAPVGGGGLISGTCIVAKKHSISVMAGEPTGADDAARSKAAGKLIPQLEPKTIADGLRTSLGSLTWPFIRDDVSQVITIDEQTIVATMKLFFERSKQLVEPSSAVAIAAALSDDVLANDRFQRIGVIISGGNVDLDNLPW